MLVAAEVDASSDDLDGATALQAAWLASLDPRLTVEARYVVAPPARSRLVLLARAEGVGAGDAATYLAAAPGVTTRPLTEPADVAGVLQPFRPHRDGMVEVRKQVRTAQPLRPDAGVRYYACVVPFATVPASRALLSDALTRAGLPLLLGVTVRSAPRPPWLAGFLAGNAAEYERLARPATWRPAGSVHQPLRHLAPEPFAVTAAAHYRDAAERYGGPLARLRVHLSSPAPVPEALAHLVGGAFGTCALGRPPTPDAAASFERALGALEPSSWPDVQGLGEQFRVLSVAADPVESAVALGLSSWGAGARERTDTERALDVLAAVGRAMERNAPTYAGCGEETLRDHVVTALNGAFAGGVTAEARNGRGRTDVLVRVADRTALVVECKVWHGAAHLRRGVDQLLGNVVRGDAGAALVTFLRGGGPADVLSRADAAFREHPAYVRAAGQADGSRRDYVLRRGDGGELPVAFLAVG